MRFAEEIVFDVLEQRGYSFPSMLRSTDLCRWYLARKGEALFEVEAYDSESYGCETLADYLKSLNALPSNNSFFRKPKEIVADRKVTCVIREYIEGEPLHTFFIRPGELPLDDALQKVTGFEKVHKFLIENNLENFAPVSVMLFACEDGCFLIDAVKCGPWVKKYENLTLISNYLNPELGWKEQIHFFRNSFALKVFTGDPRSEKYEAGKGKAVDVFIEGILNNKNSYSESLSKLIKKYRPRSKRFLLHAVIIALVFSLPLIAYLFRVMQSDSVWMGASYTDNRHIEDKTEERDEFAFEPDEVEAVLVSHEFKQRALQIDEKMLAGNFKSAKDDIDELSAVNLRKGELEILQELKTAYPKRRKADFEKAVSLSRSLITQFKFDEANRVLTDIVERYQSGSDVEQALSSLKRIRSMKEAAAAEEKDKAARQAAALAKDKHMISKLEELQGKVLKSPVQDLNGLNQSIELLRIECSSKAAKYLVSCSMKMNMAERRLYEQLLTFADDDEKKQRIELIKSKVSALGALEIYDIIETGIEYKDSSGGGNYKFSKIPSRVMYSLFKETSKVDVERAAYYLYLFCLKHGLTKEAAVEFKNIHVRELKREADSMRDIKKARSDLFATK